ncbi:MULTISPECIES: hypothetical protein [unclassified Methylobacterium]|uniref:hypothetical protein n=1 Tax=unclassified Methylobacterium TaxID=2615210 RepID=UPI0005B85309|nr:MULTISPECIES: hypothetical protein [unclassified Methylobacterium]SFV11713.1 hypothetical protein SAMN02799643_05544 [Methylobacterium sp. UNCCL125]
MLKRLVLRWLLRGQPATPAPIVHRGERELTSGPDLGAPAGPIAKLSREDAERLLGIPVRSHR